jgi:hypothetical protein
MSGDSANGRAVEPDGWTTAGVGGSAAPAGDASADVSESARAAIPADSAAAFTVGRIPLLPWPFYGRRSLARLGPGGVAELPAGSPEHKLLDLLDFAECAGRPRRSVETCYFLEGGRVYAVRREAGPASRFRLTPLDVPRGVSPGAGAAYVDTSAPDGPVLVVPPGAETTLLESAP